jgi:hypothetical protein
MVRLWVVVALAISTLACSGVGAPGKPTAIRVLAAPCGGYEAEIDYLGAGVAVAVNGEPRGELPRAPGPETSTVHGTGRPGERIEVVARGPGGQVTGSIVLPEVRPPVSIAVERDMRPATRLPIGARPVLAVSMVLGSCPTDGWQWTATLPDGTRSGPHPLELVGEDVPLLASAPGPVVVHVDLERNDGAKWAEDARYEVVTSTDADHDGADHVDAGGGDCDDADPAVHPGATEREDGKDQDCNGLVDDHTLAYDDDGDGVSERAGDCDDGDATRAPGRPETPDCRDENCDGVADDGLVRPTADDSFEPNDTREHAYGLGTDPRTELAIVSRGADDAEWFRFATNDHPVVDEPLRAVGSLLTGSLDGWRLKVVARQLPDGGAYRVEFWRDGARRGGGTLSALDQKVRMDGSILQDETGEWQIRIAPERGVADWCPATFLLRGD